MCIKDVSAIQVRNQIKLCIKQWSCSVLGVVSDPLRFLRAGPPGVSGEEKQCSVSGAVFAAHLDVLMMWAGEKGIRA